MSIAAAQALFASLQPGASIFLQSGGGESLALQPLFGSVASGAVAPRLFSGLVPGLNDFDYAAALDGAELSSLLLPPALREGFMAGRVKLWPTSYMGAARWLAREPFDLAVLHVAPPVNGRAALGLTADLGPIIWPLARRRLLIVNPAMPSLKGAATIDASLADVVIELAGGVPVLPPQGEDDIARAIGVHVASLARDGDSLQVGIGRIPDCVLAALAGHRKLALHSGAVGDGLIGLAEAGALQPGRSHRIGTVVGSAKLHRFVAENDLLEIVDTRATHAPEVFARLPRFMSINSALEVDLFGQVNLEWRGGRFNSGVGGSPDFVRGAACAPGGRSVIALPSAMKGGTRIVPKLDTPTVSIGMHDVDTVVTEHGVAAVGDLPFDARAEALIAIAAPEHRAALANAWDAMRRRL